jgi:MFS family permease
LYFQAINGDSAVQAGIKTLPLLIATVTTSILSGGLVSVVGYYNPFVLPSMVLFTVGAGMITTFAVDSPLRVWFGFQVLCGLGIGVGFQTGVLVVQNNMPQEWVPQATACVQFFQSLGGAVFIAVAQSVFQNGLTSGVEKNAPGIPPEIFINSGASQVREVLASLNASQYLDVVLDAYLQGLRHAYFITVACGAAAFIAASCLSWKKLSKPDTTTDVEINPAEAAAADNLGVDSTRKEGAA